MINSAGPKSESQMRGDFLKLDNDFFISRRGVQVDTVIFDESTDKSRSKNIFTRIFGKLMEWRAKNWVREYVTKNTFYLPGSSDFLKNINSSAGIKRDDFMNLMLDAKISRSPLFLRPVGNTHGFNPNYAIVNPERSLLEFLGKIIEPSPSKESVKIFFNFIDHGNYQIEQKDIVLALEFLDKFRQWSEKNEDSKLLKKMKGSVNIFHSFISKKINNYELSDTAINFRKLKKINDEYKNIQEAFEILLDKKNGIETILFNQDSSDEMKISASSFLQYIKNQSCAVNFSNIDSLKKWVEIFNEKFIDDLPFHYQYLAPSFTVAVNKLKIDIKNFDSKDYKKKLSFSVL